MAITQEEYNKKFKFYMKVFYILIALTVFEGLVIIAQPPKMIQTLLIVVASLAKAVYVGWYFMHLNHESKLFKISLLFPLFVSFFYAVYVIYDTVDYQGRHVHPYKIEPERKFGARNVEEGLRDEFGYPLKTEDELKKEKEAAEAEDDFS